MLQFSPVTSPKMDMPTLLALHAGFALMGSAQINLVSFHPFFAYLRAHRSTIRTLSLPVDLASLPRMQVSVPFHRVIDIHKRTPLHWPACCLILYNKAGHLGLNYLSATVGGAYTYDAGTTYTSTTSSTLPVRRKAPSRSLRPRMEV